MAIINGKDVDKLAFGGELFDKAYAKEKYYVKNNPAIVVSPSNTYNTDFSDEYYSGTLLPNEPREKFVIGEFESKGIDYLAVTSFRELDTDYHTEMYVVRKADCVLAKWGGKLAHLYTVVKRFIALRGAVIAWQ